MEFRQTGRISANVLPEEIQEQCDRLLQSHVFAHSRQLQKLLAFMVRRSLLTNHGRITQDMIAGQVLQAADFNPLCDSRVRRLAGRLRDHLRDYYGTEGQGDAVLFDFPKGQPYRLLATRRRSIEAEHPLSGRAFSEYQKGRALWARRTPDSLRAAMACFRRAIDLFPAYSRAHSGLGDCYYFMAICGSPPWETLPRVKTHVRRAIQIDEGNPEAHALLASVLSAYEWDWASATSEFERALALDDKDAGTYCLYASHLVSLGRYQQAARAVRLAQAAEPTATSVLINSHAAKVLFVAGNHQEAASLLDRIRDENPHYYLTHYFLGILEGMVGARYRSAIGSLQKAAELSGQNSSVLSVLGSVQARAGHVSEAERALHVLLRRRQQMYVPSTDLASLYWDLGRTEEAFAYLERAFEEKCIFLSWLGGWPPLKGLAARPQGKDILRRMGLTR